MSFCGFDIDKVRKLKRALDSAASGSPNLSGQVGRTTDEANRWGVLGAGVSPRVLAGTASSGEDTDRKGLSTVQRQVPDVAAEVGRRLRHLIACKSLSDAGFTINPDVVFADAPAPDVDTVRSTIKDLRKTLDSDDLGRGKDAYKLLDRLSPDEAEAVLAALSDDDLGHLQDALSKYDYVVTLGAADYLGLPSDKRIAFANKYFPSLSRDVLRRLSTHVAALEPDFGQLEGRDNTDQKDLHWAWAIDALNFGNDSPKDLDQGDLGDCWFLAALGSEVQRDPDFLRKHISDNGNGSFTVTLYKDGKPQQVVVDGALPYNSWNATAFSHTPSDGANYPLIYEKAFAQLNGSYSAIEDGWGDEGMSALSGRHTTRKDSDDVSLADLDKALHTDHKAVTIGSDSHHSGFLWLHKDEDFPGDHKIVCSHEYVVTDVDPKKGTITLRNPWGNSQSDTHPGTITITKDEYDKYFREAAFGD